MSSQVVVVDNHYAAIGGLDLCFNRWDTHTHPLADVHPTDFSKTLFPGQDYNNPRVMDFQGVDSCAHSQLSILETARMPWHDVCFLYLYSSGKLLMKELCAGSYDPFWSSCPGCLPTLH